MKSTNPSAHAWSRLARLAAHASPEAGSLPYGFASRVVAAWKADRRETNLAAFEWLTLRGLAVALVIFAGSAAFGYETITSVFAGETPAVGEWLDMVSLPL
jgi:hypothetical protein